MSVLLLKNALCSGSCRYKISIRPWSRAHQHSQTTTGTGHKKIWECERGETDALTIPFDITFGPLKEWAERLDFHEWYGAPRRPFIPATCSHFVLAIQEEPPCGRQPLERVLLLPVKQGAPLWTILMHEWDIELVGRGGEGWKQRERRRGGYCVLCCSGVHFCKHWRMSVNAHLCYDLFQPLGGIQDLNCQKSFTLRQQQKESLKHVNKWWTLSHLGYVCRFPR